MGWSHSESIGCLGDAVAGLGCDLPYLSPAFLPSNRDFLCLHKMSCIFAGQYLSSFPSLQMSFETPFAGFLTAKDVLIALDLFWGWRSGKHPLNWCHIEPIPILQSLMSLALLCVPAQARVDWGSTVPHAGKKQRAPKENTILERMHLFAFIYLPKAFRLIFLIFPLQLHGQGLVSFS